MSERFKLDENKNASKNTRLPIAEEFSRYRFGRDALAHVFRYLFIAERIVKMAKDLGRPLTILDIGCGDIYVARVLVSSFRVKKTDTVAHYVGLDIDGHSLERTEKTKPASLSISLIQGDITDDALAQFQDSEFDLVICTEVFEHLQPQFIQPILLEIRRIGKAAMISTPNFAGGTGKLPADHIKEWNCDELTGLMRDCGLIIKSRIGTFCNLNKVAALAKEDKWVAGILGFLKGRMDSHLLSLCMARFIGTGAQNILYLCDLP